MDQDILVGLLPAVEAAAVEAGKAILDVAADVGEVVDKADGSPVTRADMAAHHIIVAALELLTPRLPILSEEGDLDAFVAGHHETFWCVDPLDGTKEFVNGFDEYTVNIAVIADGAPILGVVYVPPKDMLYSAAAGHGAWRRVAGSAEPAERIAPSKRAKPVSAVASRSHLDARTQAFLDRLGVTEVIRSGSSVKMTAVAEGSADIYPRFGPTHIWDTAAGAAVAIEAGCRVLDLDGAPMSYDPAGGLKRPGFFVVPVGMELPLR